MCSIMRYNALSGRESSLTLLCFFLVTAILNGFGCDSLTVEAVCVTAFGMVIVHRTAGRGVVQKREKKGGPVKAGRMSREC